MKTQFHKLVDAALFCISLWIVYQIRSAIPISVFGGSPEIEASFQAHYMWLWLLIFPSTPLLLETQGFYNRPWLPTMKQTFFPALKACIISTVGIMTVVFLFRNEGNLVARSIVLMYGFMSFILLILKEELIRLAILQQLENARFKRKIILIGTPEDTRKFETDLKGKSHESIDVIAHLDLNNTSIQELVQLLHDHSVNGVVITAKHTYFGQIEKAILACELEGVEVWLSADFFKTQISHTTVDDFYGLPMMVFRSAPEASWQGVAKEVLDILGAMVLLILLSPLLVGVALAIRLTSPGPVLFRQERSGLNGEPFTMLKFRSMVSDAEQLKQELEALNEMSGPVFKVSNDPRVTPIGRFIRKYSIDEFPQLINVVRGEMSLVGPRPLPVDEVRRFDDFSHRRRLSVKPGLTCLWQISGRNNVKDFKTWVRLDLEYIDNWSFWLDLKIIIKTIPVVLLGTGAK